MITSESTANDGNGNNGDDAKEKEKEIQRLRKALEHVSALSLRAREELMKEREQHAAQLLALKAGTMRPTV